jgi:hypothetical protein
MSIRCPAEGHDAFRLNSPVTGVSINDTVVAPTLVTGSPSLRFGGRAEAGRLRRDRY